MKEGIRVYNLYPKLVGKMDKWVEHFDRIKEMNFDWVYVNPFHSTGLSSYAVKDYYAYNPLFSKGTMNGEDYTEADLEANKEKGNELLKYVCSEANKRGMNIMMDLVINHTATDAVITKTHPEWYMRNHDGSIKHPGAMDGNNWIEWGDLAQIDNEHSSDKDGLWEYWLDVILFYASIGIRGFRCDAAYHISPKLWKFLIEHTKSKYPDAVFLAETLGCTPDELMKTADTGFDYVMNSFKWWDFTADYFLKDYREWAGKYPSMTFPENHDTARYAEEVGYNENLAIFKYAVCSYFCSSIATTIGFEYGFGRRLDVVQTIPDWWEDKKYDISSSIAKINNIKSSYKVLQEDNMIDVLRADCDVFAFAKTSLDGKEKVVVIANRNGHGVNEVYFHDLYAIMGSDKVEDISHGYRMSGIPCNFHYNLNPGEVKLLYSKRG